MENFFTLTFGSIGVNDIVDISIIAFVIYKVLEFVKETRAQQIIKGLLLLIAVFFLSNLFHLYAINWLLKCIATMGILSLIVVFQPEIRRALENLGKSKFIIGQIKKFNKKDAEIISKTIADAVFQLSSSKTGALIILEQEVALSDIAENGTIIDSKISSQLLRNVFYEGAPLHDGAVILRADRIFAAGCVLPLTNRQNLCKELGTRHRAGIGISEKSDCISIIVSEETGIVSVAEKGEIIRKIKKEQLINKLTDLYEEHKLSLFDISAKQNKEEENDDR